MGLELWRIITEQQFDDRPVFLSLVSGNRGCMTHMIIPLTLTLGKVLPQQFQEFALAQHLILGEPAQFPLSNLSHAVGFQVAIRRFIQGVFSLDGIAVATIDPVRQNIQNTQTVLARRGGKDRVVLVSDTWHCHSSPSTRVDVWSVACQMVLLSPSRKISAHS